MARPLQLRVELVGVEPLVWRRIILTDVLTLLELHVVLQGAMGWQDSHIHSFEIGGFKYEVPEDDVYGPEEGYLDEREFVLEGVLKGISEFEYMYDPGDNWRHRIEVENVIPSIHQRMYWASCIDGQNACPPEDSGGPYDYPDILVVLNDERHPEHHDTLRWLGSFNPKEFSISQATTQIGLLCTIYRERGKGFLANWSEVLVGLYAEQDNN